MLGCDRYSWRASQDAFWSSDLRERKMYQCSYVYQSVHKYVDIQAAYLRDGLWKKDRIFSGLRCKESIDDFTLLLKWSRLVIEVRPTVSALRCFHTSSS